MRSLTTVVTRPAPADPDADLLRRIADGDRGAAIGALYDQHGGGLHRFGLRLLDDRSLAEELVQETFVRVWRNAGGFEPGRGSVRGWIYTIARNVAHDLHRRRARQVPGGEAGDPGALDGRLDAVLVEITVRDALDDLRPEHRDVLVLAYHRGLPQTEVARALDLPLGTVKSRTSTALRQLRTALLERGVDA